jgi:DNA-binding transcriptional MerR regulator
MEKALPQIPAKRYFTIGEVSELCAVKPYVLRYWEQEFTQLKPMKRRGNRRYYQHHEVLLIRRIRDLLYGQGFTISGARNRLAEPLLGAQAPGAEGREEFAEAEDSGPGFQTEVTGVSVAADAPAADSEPAPALLESEQLRAELLSIRELLSGPELAGTV